MRELKEYLRIERTLCFYSARKTFAQFASELGIPDGVIDYCLGHSTKSKGVIRFYNKVKQKQAEIAINRVIDYVNDPEKYKDYIEMRSDIMLMKGQSKGSYSAASSNFAFNRHSLSTAGLKRVWVMRTNELDVAFDEFFYIYDVLALAQT